jgi:molecular chaperone GrpE
MRSSPGTEHPTQEEPQQADSRSGDELRAELAAVEDRYVRARADLENYRKRTERDLERRARELADGLLREWLEVVDSVERALTAEPDPRAAEGLQALLEQMDSILARRGVTRFGEPGEQFDPERHEAIAVVPGSGLPAGTVAGVARSGYAAGDRVLRPAQVAVARGDGGGD